MKTTANTPKGKIEAIPISDGDFYGLAIDINGVQVARIEYNDNAKLHTVMIWDGSRENYVHLQVYSDTLGED